MFIRGVVAWEPRVPCIFHNSRKAQVLILCWWNTNSTTNKEHAGFKQISHNQIIFRYIPKKPQGSVSFLSDSQHHHSLSTAAFPSLTQLHFNYIVDIFPTSHSCDLWGLKVQFCSQQESNCTNSGTSQLQYLHQQPAEHLMCNLIKATASS